MAVLTFGLGILISIYFFSTVRRAPRHCSLRLLCVPFTRMGTRPYPPRLLWPAVPPIALSPLNFFSTLFPPHFRFYSFCSSRDCQVNSCMLFSNSTGRPLPTSYSHTYLKALQDVLPLPLPDPSLVGAQPMITDDDDDRNCGLMSPARKRNMSMSSSSSSAAASAFDAKLPRLTPEINSIRTKAMKMWCV
jgi:hypothetical protein